MYGGKTYDSITEADKKKIQGILREKEFTEKIYNNLLRFDEIARELDITSSQLAYAWTLQVDNVSVALMSTRKPERIEENIIATETTLSDETIKEIQIRQGRR